MRGKRSQAAVRERPTGIVPLHDAVRSVKESATAKFDETIEIHVHLGVDPKQSDQSVRGTVVLPHGSPSSVRIAVFTDDVKLQDKAKAAGAELVGGKELTEKVSAEKGLSADVAVATPDMMNSLAKIAKILGPRGLMPNPKSGTIGPDPAQIVKSLKSGKITFKMDDSANVHVAVAKASWDTERIEENARALVGAIRQAKPASAKGEYIRSVTMTSTMGPGVRVRV
jgi:large subunit ribosomal protein L1